MCTRTCLSYFSTCFIPCWLCVGAFAAWSTCFKDIFFHMFDFVLTRVLCVGAFPGQCTCLTYFFACFDPILTVLVHSQVCKCLINFAIGLILYWLSLTSFHAYRKYVFDIWPIRAISGLPSLTSSPAYREYVFDILLIWFNPTLIESHVLFARSQFAPRLWEDVCTWHFPHWHTTYRVWCICVFVRLYVYTAGFYPILTQSNLNMFDGVQPAARDWKIVFPTVYLFTVSTCLKYLALVWSHACRG